ncbi:MAG: hypothetical protein IT548_13150 [Alphaproteobacteria bacterium]|nr:hypothetical protein [Alphaproteobacteria bacterium]
MRGLILAAAALSLAACATPSGTQQPRRYPTDPISGFAWCMSFGCSDMQVGVRVTPAQWTEIGAFFDGTRDAADERARVARAVSRFEQIAGEITGTRIDEGGTGILPTRGLGQLDCYAEAGNTTTTLTMIAKAGFLKFHTVDAVTVRGFGHKGFMPIHATATLRENADGHLWVVDTWYYDNGGPTFVVDRQEWLDGWSPEGGTHF